MTEELEPNYRGILFILIFIGAILYFTYPLLIPHKEPVNLTPVVIEPIIIEKTIIITPTPDNGIYYASETETGTRKLGRYFSYFRDNATGYKDLSFHVTCYGYRFADSIHFWNLGDNQYYEIIPSEPDKKFFFAFIQYYTDDIIGDDVRNWIPNENHYFVKYNDNLYSPIPFNQELRIKELENTATKDGATFIQYYGQWVKQALYGKDAGKPISEDYFISYGGVSNNIDGYIIYEIPKEASENDLQVIGSFFAFGQSEWVLKR